MSPGIRATVAVGGDHGCPVGRFAAETGRTVEQVSTSVAGGDDASVTEFLAPVPEAPDGVPASRVFSYDARTVFRVRHGEADCPCALLGRFGCPIHRYAADGDAVTLVFHAPEFEALQAVVGDLREGFDDVDVRKLLRPPLEGSADQRVFVNRGRLTDRQLEVVETAHEMGYFRRPRAANATDVADELGLSPSTVSEHLAAAQRKLMDDLLETES